MTPCRTIDPRLIRWLSVTLGLWALSCALPRDGHAQGVAPKAATAEILARSLALEAQGDLRQARQVVVDAFGAQPTDYAPSLRLAELSLQMRRSDEAVRMYRRARELPDNQPEATLGLGLALTMHGYDEIARGARGRARSDFLESLIIDDSNLEAARGLRALGGRRGTGIDVMASSISISSYSARLQLYSIHVPVRIDEKLALRFAAQQLNAPDFAAGSANVTGTTQLFAGVARDVGISTLEALGILSTASGVSTLGASSSVRIGGRFGGSASVAVLGLSAGTSVQVAPSLFAQLHPAVSVSVGTRYTDDALGSMVSPLVGVAIRSEKATFDVNAHFGRERAAFLQARPTMQPYLGTSNRGVTSAFSIRVRKQLAVLAEVQLENSDILGTFTNIGIGVRVTPR
ncbi:MAG: hypothetical protein H7099_07910 [Gemmatimonadaceae bacterium]|nr:hypothetical protein [Gemmatimonadaceae bacterium]